MIDSIKGYKIGIVGGGIRCKAMLEAIFSEPDPAERPEVLAVADPDENAAGIEFARRKGIFTTTNFRELFAIEELELLFELTPDESLKGVVQRLKAPGVLLVDHHAARAQSYPDQLLQRRQKVGPDRMNRQQCPDLNYCVAAERTSLH